MLRKAKIRDAPQIQKLINSCAEKGEMLPRALNEIYENLRDYWVVEQEDIIIGCCALHISWGDLAEVRSLAVMEEERGKGWGKRLLAASLDEAKELGLPKVFALTYVPEFFQRHGFKAIEKLQLPHKIWGECIRCVKFPNCDEVATVYQF